ncbi:MAG: VCBS repeat-containing protein [Chitinophagales bacterium]
MKLCNFSIASDLDGDGDKDVLSAAYEGDKINWFRNNGTTPLRLPTTF